MFVLLFAALKVAGQTTGYLRFDTVKIMKQNGTCELYIINKTKDSLGLLTNIGGGLTQFRRSKMLDDSTIIIGLDTLTIHGTGGTSGITQLTGDVTAGPGSGSQAATIATNAVTDSKLRQSAGLSVIGKATSGTGNVSDITATTVNTYLGYNGTSLIFADPLLQINTRYIAYVDTLGNDGTGVVNNPAKPFATVNGALDATIGLSKCIIQAGLGTFNSPDSAKMRSNIIIRGSGMPVPDYTITINNFYNNTVIATPVKMIGGTIFRGTFLIPYNRSNIHCENFGVDVGYEWVNNVNSGVEVDGFVCAQLYNPAGGLSSADGKHPLQTQTSPRTGMQFKNISVLLSSPTSPYHCFLVENSYGEIGDNLHTCMGFAGIIIKTRNSKYTNLYTEGHGTYGVICKSNDYSHCRNVTITNVVCSNIGTGYQGTGFTLDQGDPGSPGIYWITLNNATINHTQQGMSLTGDGMSINNVYIETPGNTAVMADFLIRSTISNVHARYYPGNGFDINPASVLANNATTWIGCSAVGLSGTSGDGFYVHGGSALNYFEGITSVDNTGYGMNSNGAVILGHHNFTNNTAGAINGTVTIANNDVANGKTGNTSFNAYQILAGGTTSTGALQQVSGTGTSGQVLTSNGAGALPTWQAASSAITSINSQTGSSQTISGGPGIDASSSSNVHTISLNTTLDAQVSDANNTGTSATDLYSKTVAANQFTLNGQSIHFEAAGTNNDATATVNLEALFAGNGIAGTGAVTISATGVWSIQGTIIRATSTTARVYTVVTIDNCTQKVFSTTANLTGLDWTGTNILKIQATAGGAGGGSNDITAQMWKVVFQP